MPAAALTLSGSQWTQTLSYRSFPLAQLTASPASPPPAPPAAIPLTPPLQPSDPARLSESLTAAAGADALILSLYSSAPPLHLCPEHGRGDGRHRCIDPLTLYVRGEDGEEEEEKKQPPPMLSSTPSQLAATQQQRSLGPARAAAASLTAALHPAPLTPLSAAAMAAASPASSAAAAARLSSSLFSSQSSVTPSEDVQLSLLPLPSELHALRDSLSAQRMSSASAGPAGGALDASSLSLLLTPCTDGRQRTQQLPVTQCSQRSVDARDAVPPSARTPVAARNRSARRRQASEAALDAESGGSERKRGRSAAAPPSPAVAAGCCSFLTVRPAVLHPELSAMASDEVELLYDRMHRVLQQSIAAPQHPPASSSLPSSLPPSSRPIAASADTSGAFCCPPSAQYRLRLLLYAHHALPAYAARSVFADRAGLSSAAGCSAALLDWLDARDDSSLLTAVAAAHR